MFGLRKHKCVLCFHKIRWIDDRLPFGYNVITGRKLYIHTECMP